MQSRFAQLLLAELAALGAFVSGGLALLGGAVTSTGDSQLPQWLSWGLVALFAAVAVVLGRTASRRLKRVFQRRGRPVSA